MLDLPFQAHLPHWEHLLCLSGSPPSTQSIAQVTLEGDTRWKSCGYLLIQHFVTMMVSSPLLSAGPQAIASQFASLPQACAYPELPHE